MNSFLLLEECHWIGGIQYQGYVAEDHLSDLQNLVFSS